MALLGAQRFAPTVDAVVAAIGAEGRIATITAGWQEREAEDQELHEHLGKRTVNLKIWERAEQAFRADRELRAGHRRRGELLRMRQDFYRVRIEHELMAAHVIQTRSAPAGILAEERDTMIRAIQDEDARHVAECTRVRAEFTEQFRPLERDAIVRHRREITDLLADTGSVAIAGGHVAVLLNRLELFGIADLVEERAVVAWSAGAMAISERVVLFHDSPPQGRGAAEVLDAGLGLVPGVVPLPHPETRLLLHDRERVSMLVRRFAPARCLAFPSGSTIIRRNGVWERSSGVIELLRDGTTNEV